MICVWGGIKCVRERKEQEIEEGETDGERKRRVMKLTCWQIQRWQGQTDRKHQQKGNVKVHFTVVSQRSLAVSTPGVQSKHQDPLIVTFFVSLCLLSELKVKCCRTKWKRLRGARGKKHCLAARTEKKTLVWSDSSVQKCVSRSLSDLSALFPHAVITGPTLKYCLQDGNSFSTWLLFSETRLSR